MSLNPSSPRTTISSQPVRYAQEKKGKSRAQTNVLYMSCCPDLSQNMERPEELKGSLLNDVKTEAGLERSAVPSEVKYHLSLSLVRARGGEIAGSLPYSHSSSPRSSHNLPRV